MILNKRIILQTRTVTQDNEGIDVESWTSNNTWISVDIQPNNNTHYEFTPHGKSDRTFEFLIFATKTALITKNSRQRIVDGTNIYDIERVKEWPRHYELLCNPG